MNAQHAPPPWQAAPFGACQIASIKAQRISGGIVTANNPMQSSVRIELKTPLNRFSRAQPTAPFGPRRRPRDRDRHLVGDVGHL